MTVTITYHSIVATVSALLNDFKKSARALLDVDCISAISVFVHRFIATDKVGGVMVECLIETLELRLRSV